jgi:hypothetical protein
MRCAYCQPLDLKTTPTKHSLSLLMIGKQLHEVEQVSKPTMTLEETALFDELGWARIDDNACP